MEYLGNVTLENDKASCVVIGGDGFIYAIGHSSGNLYRIDATTFTISSQVNGFVSAIDADYGPYYTGGYAVDTAGNFMFAVVAISGGTPGVDPAITVLKINLTTMAFDSEFVLGAQDRVIAATGQTMIYDPITSYLYLAIYNTEDNKSAVYRIDATTMTNTASSPLLYDATTEPFNFETIGMDSTYVYVSAEDKASDAGHRVGRILRILKSTFAKFGSPLVFASQFSTTIGISGLDVDTTNEFLYVSIAYNAHPNGILWKIDTSSFAVTDSLEFPGPPGEVQLEPGNGVIYGPDGFVYMALFGNTENLNNTVNGSITRIDVSGGLTQVDDLTEIFPTWQWPAPLFVLNTSNGDGYFSGYPGGILSGNVNGPGLGRFGWANFGANAPDRPQEQPPNSGIGKEGQQLIIHGKNIGNVLGVKINGVSVPSSNWHTIDTISIYLSIPTGTTSGALDVTYFDGSNNVDTTIANITITSNQAAQYAIITG